MLWHVRVVALFVPRKLLDHFQNSYQISVQLACLRWNAILLLSKYSKGFVTKWQQHRL